MLPKYAVPPSESGLYATFPSPEGIGVSTPASFLPAVSVNENRPVASWWDVPSALSIAFVTGMFTSTAEVSYLLIKVVELYSSFTVPSEFQTVSAP